VRGWISYDPTGAQEDFPEAAPPAGDVTVTGIVQLTQERGSLGAVDAAEGTLQSMARIDLARFAQQLDLPLGGAWVMLDEQTPPQPDGIPATVEVAAADSSQNFGYMVQWWIFATIALIGYPLVLRRVARQRREGTPPDGPPSPDDTTAAAPAGSAPSS
jgi:cytochrome oxidase assembly protein ShyY1